MDNHVKYLPHVAVMAKKYVQNREYILARLEISEAAYNTFQYNRAIDWLRASVWLKDDDLITFITSLPEFWTWYINHWNIIDDAFYHTNFDDFINPRFSEQALRQRWHMAHGVNSIRSPLPDDIIKKLFVWANGKEVKNG